MTVKYLQSFTFLRAFSSRVLRHSRLVVTGFGFRGKSNQKEKISFSAIDVFAFVFPAEDERKKETWCENRLEGDCVSDFLSTKKLIGDGTTKARKHFPDFSDLSQTKAMIKGKLNQAKTTENQEESESLVRCQTFFLLRAVFSLWKALSSSFAENSERRHQKPNVIKAKELVSLSRKHNKLLKASKQSSQQ